MSSARCVKLILLKWVDTTEPLCFSFFAYISPIATVWVPMESCRVWWCPCSVAGIPHPLLGRPTGPNPFLPQGPGAPGGPLLPRPRFSDPFGPGAGPGGPFGPGAGPGGPFMALGGGASCNSQASPFSSFRGHRFLWHVTSPHPLATSPSAPSEDTGSCDTSPAHTHSPPHLQLLPRTLAPLPWLASPNSPFGFLGVWGWSVSKLLAFRWIPFSWQWCIGVHERNVLEK